MSQARDPARNIPNDSHMASQHSQLTITAKSHAFACVYFHRPSRRGHVSPMRYNAGRRKPTQTTGSRRRVPQRSWPLSVASTTISSHSSTSAPCTRVGLATTGVGVLKRELRPYIAAVPATSSPPPRCAFTSHAAPAAAICSSSRLTQRSMHRRCTQRTPSPPCVSTYATAPAPPGPQAQACGGPPRTALLACVQSTCRL